MLKSLSYTLHRVNNMTAKNERKGQKEIEREKEENVNSSD